MFAIRVAFCSYKSTCLIPLSRICKSPRCWLPRAVAAVKTGRLAWHERMTIKWIYECSSIRHSVWTCKNLSSIILDLWPISSKVWLFLFIWHLTCMPFSALEVLSISEWFTMHHNASRFSSFIPSPISHLWHGGKEQLETVAPASRLACPAACHACLALLSHAKYSENIVSIETESENNS